MGSNDLFITDDFLMAKYFVQISCEGNTIFIIVKTNVTDKYENYVNFQNIHPDNLHIQKKLGVGKQRLKPLMVGVEAYYNQ